MRSHCATSKVSPHTSRPRVLSLSGPADKGKSGARPRVTVSQMLSNPGIFLSQEYCGERPNSKKLRGAVKSLNTSLRMSLRGEEKKASAREVTRASSRCSAREVEEAAGKSGKYRSILKRLESKKIEAEEYPIIIKSLLEEIDMKSKLIEGFKNMLKANTKKIGILEKKLSISKEGMEIKSVEIENVRRQYNKMLNQVKELLNLKEAAKKDRKPKSKGLLCERKSLHNLTLKNSLEEAIRSLQPNTPKEQLQALDQQRTPGMVHFIAEVSKLVSQSCSAPNLETVLSTLKTWMVERTECGQILLLRNKLCRVLYGDNVSVADHTIVL